MGEKAGQYEQNEQIIINTFLQKTDYYVIAQTRANMHTVVTHEVPSSYTKKIKIPDVCIGMGVKYVTPY